MISIITLRDHANKWGAEVSTLISVRLWGFFVTALVMALGIAKYVYLHLDVPQTYSELIVGGIAWTYQNKFHDYALLYALAFSFLGALLLILSLVLSVKRRVGNGGIEKMHDFLLLLNLPAALWFAGLWTTKDISLSLLTISQGSIVVALIFAALFAQRGKAYWRRDQQLFFDGLSHAMLFVVFAGLAVAAVGVAANRLGAIYHWHDWMSSAITLRRAKTMIVCATLACGGWIIYAPEPRQLVKGLRILSASAQFFLPLFFFCMLPPAWLSAEGENLALGYDLSSSGKILIAVCIIAAWIEQILAGRFQSSLRDRTKVYLPGAGAIVAILLFLKNSPFSLPVRMWDDYHFGEMLVPWWSWFQMGQIPFWDYAPARGLMNYLPGFFSAMVFGGTPAATEATYPIIYALLATIAVFILRPFLGTKGTFLALLLGPFANAIGEIDLVISMFLFAACHGWLHWQRDRWLTFMVAAGSSILLYAPGQGALALLACSPLMGVAFQRLYVSSRRKLAMTLFFISGVVAILCILTPFAKMMYGAIRYGFEQSSINSVAHGINWNSTFGVVGFNPWAFEIVRASFILVVLWASVLVFKAVFVQGDTALKRRVLVYASPVLIIGLLFVIRAAGRVDPGMSRLGVASNWALALLAPMLLHASVRHVRNAHLFCWFLIAGLLLPYVGNVPVSAYAANFNVENKIPVNETPFSRSLAGSRLAAGSEGPEHPARIEAVRKTLSQILDPQDTYLDLSGRHAMYYYVNRRPALESASMYNLVGEKQQLRAIASIRSLNPPAILLSADNIVQDGGPSSLRSNLVYREVLLSKGYELVATGNQVWMVRSDRVGRLNLEETAAIADIDEGALLILDPIYRQQDFRDLPASWGRSAKSLNKEMSDPVLRIDTDTPTSSGAVHRLGNGSYAIDGSDPHVRFDISHAKLSGDQAGLLSFDFSCESPDAVPAIGLYWTTPKTTEGSTTFLTFHGQQGRLIVPVDSAPSWLLAKRIDTLRFDIDGDSAGCNKFSIRNVELLARTATLTP